MATTDVVVQKALYFCLVPILLIFLMFMFIQKFGSSLKERLISAFWNRAMVKYHTAMRDIKKIHFHSMNYHKSADLYLRNRGLLRILEIGAGSGANFEFFPPNSKLTVVEPNAFFEPLFYKRQSTSNIKMEKFILTNAEDMKEVEDNSMDVVVSTLVLCSVRNVKQTLKEVHRVLAPGGKFYYWEHVHDVPGTWLHFLQNLLTYTIWDLCFGCHLNRNIDHLVAEDKTLFSHIDQKRFDISLKKSLVWKLVRVHVMGVATK
ncbi:methyltransferase-like protein 7A [Daphnia pulicaria]|uniref:methyltransferase-like protein 7A n=1 Tax=Daphnia pulicaria TaxID=35523 RepID=UPI001EEA357E|nr:methyltransferase-like protein 7A [Daphnia pulicaria]